MDVVGRYRARRPGFPDTSFCPRIRKVEDCQSKLQRPFPHPGGLKSPDASMDASRRLLFVHRPDRDLGLGAWIPVWVDQLAGETQPTAKAEVAMLSAMGAILGCVSGPLIGERLGRRPAFFGLCFASLVVCGVLFRMELDYGTTFKCLVFAGMTTAAFYGWFPLYLPELFPTRCRATGQGIGYNMGRIMAAGCAIGSGQLVAVFDGDYARMGAVITLVYLVGMIVIWWAPEIRGSLCRNEQTLIYEIRLIGIVRLKGK